MKNISLLVFLFSVIANVFAGIDTIKPPVQRQRFHNKINDEQLMLDKADGKIDGKISISNNEEINLSVSNAILRKIDLLQDSIELNNKIPANNEKIRYLTCLQDMVKAFRINWKLRNIKPADAGALVDNFTNIMQATIAGESMVPFINQAPYEICSITTGIFKYNIGYSLSKNIVYLKFCSLNPGKILKTISAFIKEPFADSLITVTGRNDPMQVYRYAQDTASAVSKLIYKSRDQTIKTIVALSQIPSSLLYFPFLDDIVSGKKQTGSLKEIIGDTGKDCNSIAYYKLLVHTEIDYNKRLKEGDTAVAFLGTNGLRAMLKRKAIELFITPINELHESPEDIRMKAIDALSPVDIYYMLVMGDDDIYTSSYEKSFDRMLQRMGKKVSTDSLLQQAGYDYFRKFIKMAANFNKLDIFLKLMPPENAASLMKSFVSGLDVNDNLEDAVDVADSYSSISNKKLQANI